VEAPERCRSGWWVYTAAHMQAKIIFKAVSNPATTRRRICGN